MDLNEFWTFGGVNDGCPGTFSTPLEAIVFKFVLEHRGNEKYIFFSKNHKRRTKTDMDNWFLALVHQYNEV